MSSFLRSPPRWILSAAAGLLCLAAAVLLPAHEPTGDDVRHADDTRLAALVSGDPSQLGAILSPDLVYTHSNGLVNDKASYLELITSGHLKYLSVDYETRNFLMAESDIAVMTGRCHIKALNKGALEQHYLSFLAVWRREQGSWRFLAWQSCGLPDGKP